MLSNTFAGISPASAPGFVVAQAVGGAVGLLAVKTLFPTISDVAGRVVVPRQEAGDPQSL